MNHIYIDISIFFFNDTATTEIYTLSLHDALPIFPHRLQFRCSEGWWPCHPRPNAARGQTCSGNARNHEAYWPTTGGAGVLLACVSHLGVPAAGTKFLKLAAAT